MRLKKLSLCLSAVIILGSSAFFGAAVRASETAGEGATAVETAPAVEENAGDSQTDAAGNVITHPIQPAARKPRSRHRIPPELR